MSQCIQGDGCVKNCKILLTYFVHSPSDSSIRGEDCRCISNVLPDRVMGTNLLSGIPFQCSSLPKGTFSLWTRCWACTNWWQAASSSSLQSSSLSRMVMLGGTSARFWVSLIFLVLHSRIRALLMACRACVYSTSIINYRVFFRFLDPN